MNIEKYDQYIWIPILLIVAMILLTKLDITRWLIVGFIVGLLGLALFNKGRKEEVNLKSDIAPIAFATVLLFAALYYILRYGAEMLSIGIIIILIIAIATLYQ